MAKFNAAFFSLMYHKRGKENILMPINSCLHNQKGHTHRLKDQHSDYQLQNPAVIYLLQQLRWPFIAEHVSQHLIKCQNWNQTTSLKVAKHKEHGISNLCIPLRNKTMQHHNVCKNKSHNCGYSFAIVWNMLFQILNIFDIRIHKVIQKEWFTVVPSLSPISTHHPESNM